MPGQDFLRPLVKSQVSPKSWVIFAVLIILSPKYVMMMPELTGETITFITVSIDFSQGGKCEKIQKKSMRFMLLYDHNVFNRMYAGGNGNRDG